MNTLNMVRVKTLVSKVCLWRDHRRDHKFHSLNLITVLLYTFDNLRDTMYRGYTESRSVIPGVRLYRMYM